MDERSSKEESSNSREHSKSNHNINIGDLANISQSEGSDQVTHNLRSHIKSPEIREEEPFGAFSSTISDILALSRFSSALTKPIDNRYH